MKPNVNQLAVCCSLVVGAGVWGGMAHKFNAADKLVYEPNIACVKGSPYGKVLALAVQGPIDFYWHNGVTHTDAETFNAESAGTDCADGCTDHDHSHDTHAHAGHGDDCGCPEHGGADVQVAEATKSLQQRAKDQIRKMAATAHRKTDGKPLSPAHQKYLQGVTEDKLRMAYELDPSNYTNYGNLHLFISSTDLGKGEADDHKALKLARKTLEFCKNDTTDPASWLTAASAAYNIVYHIGRYHKDYTIPEAKASLAEFDSCIATFDRLCAEAIEQGRIVSAARLEEMQSRAQYLQKLREAQGVYMKRMMTQEMANASTSSRIIQ